MPDIASMFLWLAMGYGGALLLCVAAPFFASYLLDTLLVLGRRRTVRPLLITASATAAVVIAGAALSHTAINATGAPAGLEQGMSTLASTLLPLMVGMALLAFLIRQLRALVASRTKSSTARSLPRAAR